MVDRDPIAVFADSPLLAVAANDDKGAASRICGESRAFKDLEPSEAVAVAKVKDLWNIGQLTDRQKRALNAAAKRGEIVKSRAYWCSLGNLRACWHPIGTDVSLGYLARFTRAA